MAQAQLSRDGFAVLAEMSASGQRPRVLHAAFTAGRVPAGDLPELIAFAWLRDDSPTSDIGDAGWLPIYDAAGFFSFRFTRSRPAGPVTLYRGASADRLYRMSWAKTSTSLPRSAPGMAGTSKPRSTQPPPPDAIRALLHRLAKAGPSSSTQIASPPSPASYPLSDGLRGVWGFCASRPTGECHGDFLLLGARLKRRLLSP